VGDQSPNTSSWIAVNDLHPPAPLHLLHQLLLI
jgi:hypothetical protein